MAKLISSTLPKSRSGRKPTPLDQELVSSLVDALKKEPLVTEGNEKRPAAYGPDTKFDTEGKATSQGRKYANVVAEELKTTVRVNAYSSNGKENGPFQWRCYIPLSSQKVEKKETDSK